MPQRIGIFGGAFDPPHQAHVALAQAAIQQLHLDTLYILPTGQAYHKSRALTPAHHRLAMAGLAFAGVAHAEVKACELERPGPTYTVDTLQAIHAKNPAAQLYLLIGWDQALALTTWHRWQDIVGLAIICIAPRTDSSASPSSHDAILAHIPAIRHLQLPLMPLSATQIRQEIALKHPINALVPDAVVRYIDQHHLYQSA